MGPTLRDNYTSTAPRPDGSEKNNGAMESEIEVEEQKNNSEATDGDGENTKVMRSAVGKA